METYESEGRKLIEWAMSENKKIDEEVKAFGFKGFDGPGVEKEKEITRIFNKKLSELKKKYGKETAVNEPDFSKKRIHV